MPDGWGSPEANLTSHSALGQRKCALPYINGPSVCSDSVSLCAQLSAIRRPHAHLARMRATGTRSACAGALNIPSAEAHGIAIRPKRASLAMPGERSTLTSRQF